MKTETLVEAKKFALQFWELEKQFMKMVPSSQQRGLIKRLVVLEDKPLEHRSESEQWEIELVNEALAEVPPYQKVSYPLGPFQPLRTPRSPEERKLQMERHIAGAMAALEGHVSAMGLDKIDAGRRAMGQPPLEFQVVDGYGPMMVRKAAQLAAQQPKPSLWTRFKGFFARLFGRKTE